MGEGMAGTGTGNGYSYSCEVRKYHVAKLGLDKLEDITLEMILSENRKFCYKQVKLEQAGEFLPQYQSDRADRYMDTLIAIEKANARPTKKLSKREQQAQPEDAAALLMQFKAMKGDKESGRAG